MRRTIAIAMLSSAVLASAFVYSAAPAGADAGLESQFVGLLNGHRASQGLPPLEVSGELVGKARGWAQHMAAGGCGGSICHSNLSSGISSSWRRLGENVGKGPSVDRLHQELVASPSHNANLLDPGFRLVGVGVFVDAGGALWVAQVFMEPASQPAPSSPAPATGTPPSPDPAPAPAVEPAPPPPPPPPPVQVTITLDRLRDLEAA